MLQFAYDMLFMCEQILQKLWLLIASLGVLNLPLVSK